MKSFMRKPGYKLVPLVLFAAICLVSCNNSSKDEKDARTDSTSTLQPEGKHAAMLDGMEQKIQDNHYTFEVGETSVLGKSISMITGEKPMSDSERIRIRTELQRTEANKKEKASPYLLVAGTRLSPDAASLDLRNYHLVTPVRDQGNAGSCWAFGSMAGYESGYGLVNSKDINTSEQYVINCSGAGTAADGGWAFEVFRWMVNTNKNIDDETTVPYLATDALCSNIPPKTDYFAIDWDFVDPGNDPSAIPTVKQIKEAMCKHGVISASVYVSDLFQAYTGGVFNEQANSFGTNHAVSLVGWDDNKKAWILKNSWGTNWGETCSSTLSERGYMWIAYNSNNVGRRAAWITARKSPK